MSTHTCPANRCTVPVSRSKLACPTHWWQLPMDLRMRVTAAYRGPGPGSGEHVDAVGAALEWYRSQPDGDPQPLPGVRP